MLVATARPTRNQQHHLQLNFPEQEQTISQKQKQDRHVVLHDKETGNYPKQCRCTVTTTSNHKASKNKQDMQLCVKILHVCVFTSHTRALNSCQTTFMLLWRFVQKFIHHMTIQQPIRHRFMFIFT